ncbi:MULTISPECIES: hypothetical protein [Flavobacterium]|jgi:hypothetical protein|uniref:Uncharacterized protein n=1 Tax=Flavobacterium lindanitolerans TaxID=428988 RepID=A0A497U185_9FLAO|nr:MULTISPECIES: hypothetical protein [Flavobacterium]PZO27505.1 MAG: hypothetical protein DCE86_13135 [Flavobacteriaceae bacterium]PZQ90186.1 MAG: hypothetical protein DI548_03230 [Flavobacterium johnsoniae]MBL7869080.1 hypothetical protein [Flavobacterium lindanitolerans]MDQ7960846.1 hypothetical protein [Flavobacterium lindanitolerans]OJX54155.1 MAG: hypothetical protein BGO88_10905 [Flavobacterium sp. 38-13]
MLEQLSDLVRQYGNDAVVNNNSVPNELNEGVMDEASTSIFSGLQKIISDGGADQIGQLFQGDNAGSASNPVVKQLTEQLSGNLGEKFGLSSDAASGVAGGLIPKVLGSLIGKAKNPNDKSFEISDIVNSLSGGQGGSSIMDAIQKYGGQFGLDQNNDGKIDMSDAMAAVNKKGGIGGFLGKLFGR